MLIIVQFGSSVGVSQERFEMYEVPSKADAATIAAVIVDIHRTFRGCRWFPSAVTADVLELYYDLSAAVAVHFEQHLSAGCLASQSGQPERVVRLSSRKPVRSVDRQPSATSTLKTCSCCGQEKPREGFGKEQWKQKKDVTGTRSCKVCTEERGAEEKAAAQARKQERVQQQLQQRQQLQSSRSGNGSHHPVGREPDKCLTVARGQKGYWESTELHQSTLVALVDVTVFAEHVDTSRQVGAFKRGQVFEVLFARRVYEGKVSPKIPNGYRIWLHVRLPGAVLGWVPGHSRDGILLTKEHGHGN